jgi:recombination protein RecT
MAKADGSDVMNKLTKKVDKPKTLVGWINSMKPEIERALPKHVDADRIARIAITTIRTNKDLQSCEPMSFIAALMQASQLGLEPNTPLGEAYIIPYKDKGVPSARFEVGYKGLLSLAHRTGEYQTIYAMEVYANDEFDYAYGLEPYLTHKPAEEPEGEPVRYYAVYHLKNGGREFRVWSRKKVEQHADKYSMAFKRGWTSPWKTDFDSMAKKTVLKDLLKYAPKSIEFSRALSMDETIKHEVAEDMSEVPADYIEIDYSVIDEGEEQENEKESDKFEEIPAM